MPFISPELSCHAPRFRSFWGVPNGTYTCGKRVDGILALNRAELLGAGRGRGKEEVGWGFREAQGSVPCGVTVRSGGSSGPLALPISGR
jgi:hypothetical protein